MVGREDLGLSLSLGFPQNHQKQQQQQHHHHHQQQQSLQFNLMPSLVPASTNSSSPLLSNPQNPCSSSNNNNNNDAFASSDRGSEICRVETRPFLRGIDVNRAPSTVDLEEEAGVSSPNSTISTLSGKRTERESNGDDADNDRSCSRGISDEEDGDNSRKKLRLSKDQSAILEESFKEHNTLNPKQKLALAKQLGLRPRQVEVWFQNRRARTKLKQTEVDCEFLKRCCENLTEENRRLQKEVQELRALKLSPQFYMQMTPPTTLTMCPSCERVAAPSTGVEAARPIAIAPAHPRPLPMNPWAPLGSIAHHAGPGHRATFDALRQRS